MINVESHGLGLTPEEVAMDVATGTARYHVDTDLRAGRLSPALTQMVTLAVAASHLAASRAVIRREQSPSVSLYDTVQVSPELRQTIGVLNRLDWEYICSVWNRYHHGYRAVVMAP